MKTTDMKKTQGMTVLPYQKCTFAANEHMETQLASGTSNRGSYKGSEIGRQKCNG